jgi:hypothetical protein
MAAWAKRIESLTIAEKDCPLCFTHNHLRTHAQVGYTNLREAMDEFICHFAWVFYDIKYSCHINTPSSRFGILNYFIKKNYG